MGKDKLRRFAENRTFECLVQPEFEEIFDRDHALKGRWHTDFFHNDRPITLELGCGKGEYTVALAQRNPDRNYIGVDIKGARMWRGAKTATECGMTNVGFIRTRIEFIESFFAEGEVSEIWITFPDPQLKSRRAKKRLTSPLFLARYARMLTPDGAINLKRTLNTYINIRRPSSTASACRAKRPTTTSTARASQTKRCRSRRHTSRCSSRASCPLPTLGSGSTAAATSNLSTGRATRFS